MTRSAATVGAMGPRRFRSFTIVAIVTSALALTSCVRPLMGTAVQADKLAGDTTYAAIAGSRFDVVAPENEMKWDATEPQLGRYTFDSADPIVAFAQAHGQKVMGAALTWWFQNPDWLQNGTFNRAAATNILQDHIQALVSRFRGKVQMWDVVNEAVRDNDPLHPDPNDPSTNYHGIALRPNVWTLPHRPDLHRGHVPRRPALRPGRPAVPQRLRHGDQRPEARGGAANGQDAAGAPSSDRRRGPPDARVLARPAASNHRIDDGRLRRHPSRRTDHRDGCGNSLAGRRDQARPAENRVRPRLQTCRAAPNCPAFIMWGFTDKYSWIPGFFPGLGAALPWDEDFQTKPAYDAIASVPTPRVT